MPSKPPDAGALAGRLEAVTRQALDALEVVADREGEFLDRAGQQALLARGELLDRLDALLGQAALDGAELIALRDAVDRVRGEQPRLGALLSRYRDRLEGEVRRLHGQRRGAGAYRSDPTPELGEGTLGEA